MNRHQVYKCPSKKDVLAVVSEFEQLGNPFEEEGEELIALHTKDVMDSDVVETVRNITQVGQSHYDKFVQERMIERSKPVTDTIKKNNLPLFNNSNKKSKTKEQSQVLALKE